jgi:hypothetical protein
MQEWVEMNLNDRTKYFAVCMANAAYPKVKVQGVDNVRSQKPKHDYTSHYRSAFEYLALGLENLQVERKTPYDKFPKKQEIKQRGSKRRIIGY